MSGWGIATEIAIRVLLVGSVGVFAWFLVEVARLARGWDNDEGGDA